MPSFRKGSSGSPWQTEVYGDMAMDPGPGAQPSESMPRIGGGALARRVNTEMTRTKRGSGGGKASTDDE
jgi:hypothetical protein